MADIKQLKTRIALKYDTYANWTDDTAEGKGANLVLLPGEIGFCAIGDTVETGKGQATTNPTVLFKVGDGVTPFKTLKWASALAADVYAWAKSETVVFNDTNKRIEFKTGETVNHYVDLSYFAKASDVADHETRLDDIEAALGIDGEATESISEQIAAIVERLGVIQGADTVEGSIAKALKDANAHADAAVEAAVGNYAVGTEGEDGYKAASGLRKEIAEAEAAANSYTDDKVATLEAKDAELEAEDKRLDKAITDEVQARKDADKAITDMIGTGFAATEGNTVAEKVAAAQKAADDAQADVDALTKGGGQVAVNTANIAQLQTDLADEVKARDEADKAIDERLVKVETFFAGAYDENGKALNEALDTLVEIQDYLDGDGDAAGTLVDKVAKNASDIKELQETLAEGGDFEQRVAAVEAAASDNADDIADLLKVTSGYTAEGAIKTAIEAAAELGQKGIDDAKAAQDTADAVKAAVEHETTGLAATKDIADAAKSASETNASDIADIKADYLKAADWFIIDCGTSTDVVYPRPTPADPAE